MGPWSRALFGPSTWGTRSCCRGGKSRRRPQRRRRWLTWDKEQICLESGNPGLIDWSPLTRRRCGRRRRCRRLRPWNPREIQFSGDATQFWISVCVILIRLRNGVKMENSEWSECYLGLSLDNCLFEQDWLRGRTPSPETPPLFKRKHFLIKKPVDDRKQKC